MDQKTANRLMAGTVKDAILHRVASYTPVDCGQDVVVLAYTRRIFEALSTFTAVNGITDIDIEKVDALIRLAEEFAIEQGFPLIEV